MSDFNGILFQIALTFQTNIENLDEALGVNLELLIRACHLDRAAVFLFDEKDLVLRPPKIVTIYGEMEGEGENPFNTRCESNFSKALCMEKEIVCAEAPEYSVYIPLVLEKKKIGVLRADNFFSKRAMKETHIKNIMKCAGTFSTGIHNSQEFGHNRRQVNKLMTLTRIGTAIATNLRMEDILEQALASLVKDLGYDRAQIYLLEDDARTIYQNLSIDFRGYFRTSENTSAITPLVTTLLGEDKPSIISRKFSSSLIAYVPIVSKGKKTGILIVDNLFTRQTMMADDLSFISIFANHLATVIENSRLFERVEKLSITDSLTGLFNHRYFYDRLGEEISRANRFNTPLTLIMMDIDYFKKFNDAFGHQMGDTVLRAVSRIILSNIRSIDVASRYGGDEIGIILSETDSAGAQKIAERIRAGIEKHLFKIGRKQTHVTVSIGLVTYPNDATLKSELVRKADLALYWIKNNGRNGVFAYSRNQLE